MILRRSVKLLGAALLIMGRPAFAVPVPRLALPPSVAAPKVLPISVDAELDAFTAQRRGAPLWFRSGEGPEGAAALSRILRRGSLDGLTSGPSLADEVELAAANAITGDAKAIARADRTLSIAWLTYVGALNGGKSEVIYYDPALARRVPDVAVTLKALAQAPSIPKHLESVSDVNPLYASLRDSAWDNMKHSGTAIPEHRLLQNLARARDFPVTGRFIVVNAATQRLMMVEGGRITGSMKVIVGRANSQTPMLASTIWYATLNPYWYVPTDLAQKLIAAHVQKDPGYLKSKGYEVISDFGVAPTMMSSSEIDWKAVEAGTAQVYLRQLPGDDNSMGKIKFSFPSDTGVYLHDTENHGLFDKVSRILSNGCVRLEDAQRLGTWLMDGVVTASTGRPEQQVMLPRGVPVFLTYITAHDQDGELVFDSDVYGRDVQNGAEARPL